MLRQSRHTLIYVRRNKVFNDIVMRFSRDFIDSLKVTYVSEYFGKDVHIDINDPSGDYCTATEHYVEESLDLEKIVFRDRVLRNMPFKDAVILIKRSVYAARKILENKSYDVLVTYPVDNYVQDILCQVARLNNIEIYGVSNFFIPGYKRITTYGEHNAVRNPSEKEVDEVIFKLQDGFRSHMAISRSRAVIWAISRYFRNKARYFIFHIFVRLILGRKEYDFLATPYVATTRSLSCFLALFFFKKKVEFKGKTILVPLHYFPEATLEYWSNSILCAEFENTLITKLSELCLSYDTVVVKDHPAMVFNHKLSFYRKLLKLKNVVLVDPFKSTSELIGDIDSLCCWTGSAGVEFLINDKPVLFCCDNYYIQASAELTEKLKGSPGQEVKIEDKRTFIKQILSGTVPW